LILTTGQTAAAGSAKASQLLSLNRASQAELEQLPGVGPTLAGRMLDWRTANGGFKKKEDLMKVSGIGPKLFASMKDLVTL
jgi:competence protein ComEA